MSEDEIKKAVREVLEQRDRTVFLVIGIGIFISIIADRFL